MDGPGESRIRTSANAWARALVMVLASGLFVPHPLLGQAGSSVTEELKALYEADQADRQVTSPQTDEYWEAVFARDARRLERVYELLKADSLSVAEDYYHASMVLQHGGTAEDVLIAHILATAAGFMGDERGYWLSAAALDRYLLHTRMPQRLGTQYYPASREDPFAVDTLEPVGQGPYIRWLPDSVRRVFGVASLEEQAERVEARNRGGGG